MAITVKEIQEKEFAILASNGYDMEQVDDFLDALAEQVGAMSQEAASLKNQVQQLQAALAAAETAKAEAIAAKEAAEKKTPDYNESGYFKNLESAMRESLIGAQRIADETVTEANKKAQQTIEDATAQAEAITASAKKAVDELQAESERLTGIVESYRANFKKLVTEQLALIEG